MAVWQDDRLIADDTKKYNDSVEQAQQFIQGLARSLGVKSEYIVTGYEDALYYLWKEGNVPDNLDPLKSDLKDGLERQRLARLLSRGLNQPTGYCLPLRKHDDGKWQSSSWTFRRGKMYLIQGDSPMGLRLPLDSLPWVERKIQEERSLFEEHPPLQEFHGEVAQRYSQWVEAPPEHEGIHEQQLEYEKIFI
ncbi:transglutaminase [Candidatus Thiomargarita nelsonii]|uniref:Transglutaminase n=1 Tax=Candidatus Thiomargarita nelsonii TaxID=1003181 RepID=A0A176RTI3_9GAMM|nr:transglutaminase [Candidatus Thiomargarita nelsonii]